MKILKNHSLNKTNLLLKGLVSFFIIIILLLVSCQKEISCEDCEPPLAHAGSDQVIILPVNNVSLDGRSSSDPDGTIISFLWSKISGPPSFTLQTQNATLTSADSLIQGVYLFELKVIDNSGLSDRDTVQITVGNGSQTNRPPVANAGTDQTIVLPTTTANLSGNGSTDPDNNIASFLWRKISGPTSFNIADANSVQTQVTSLVGGVYQFELRVTDSGGLFSKDTVQVFVVSPNSACNIDNRPLIQARLVPLGKLSICRVNIITSAANNKILFAGGSFCDIDYTGAPTHRVDIYDINSNSWSIKDLEGYPDYRLDMGIAASSNKIFIGGGGFWGDDIYTNKVDIYTTSDNSWSIAALSEYRTAATGVSTGNKIFFAGGYSFNNGSNYWSNTVDIYDNVTNAWTTGTLSERRGYLSAVTASNKIYFAGGQKNDGQFLPSDRIDEYDILSNSWSTSTLQEARSNMAAIAVGNKIFWAGGASTSGESGTVEIRDVVTGVTSFNCIIPRSWLSAVLKDDKIVFFTGYGSDPRNGTYFEIYNLTTETWSTVLLDKNIKGAAIISVNNVIYVAGGFVNGVGSDQVWKLEF